MASAPKKKDFTDSSGEDRRRATDSAKAVPHPSDLDWSVPMTIGPRPVPEFPLDTLPEWLGEYVAAVATTTETPADVAALLGLSVIATAAAKRARVCVNDDWSEPLNIFTASVLPPGSRKSAVFDKLTAPLVEWERSELERMKPLHEQALARQQTAVKRLDKATLDAARGELEEKEVARLAAEKAEIHVPPLPRVIADDCTPERMASLLAEQGGRMALLSDEGGVFELIAGRYSDGVPNMDVWLKGHAGSDLRVDRASRDAEVVLRPALTLGLTVQPGVLSALSGKPGFRERGLIARFLFAIPRNTVGWRDCDPPTIPTPVKALYRQRVLDLLGLQPAIGPGNQLVEHSLRLSPEAAGLVLRLRRELEPRLRPGGDLQHAADWVGKLVGATVRIAGLLHLAGEPEPLTAMVTAETMDAAIRIGRYCLEHALLALDEIGSDEQMSGARLILEWLERRRPERTFTRRDCHQDLRTRARFVRVAELDAPLQFLVECGHIRPTKPPVSGGKGGRPQEHVFEVHPTLRRSAVLQPVDGGSEGSECFEQGVAAR